MPLILGLTGQAGCGKGTVGTLLCERYGAELFTFSAYLRKTLDDLALEPSRDHLIKLSEALRGAFGETALSHAVARDALASTAPVVVVDGIRREADFIPALQSLPDFHLIAVEAEPRVRYERILQRGEKAGETSMTWEAFLADEQRSTEQTIPAVMAQASIHLRNDGTLDALNTQLDQIMRDLGATPAS